VLHLDCSNRLTAREPLLLSVWGSLFQTSRTKRHDQLNSHVPDLLPQAQHNVYLSRRSHDFDKGHALDCTT
jgi:hypothetical protein